MCCSVQGKSHSVTERKRAKGGREREKERGKKGVERGRNRARERERERNRAKRAIESQSVVSCDHLTRLLTLLLQNVQLDASESHVGKLHLRFPFFTNQYQLHIITAL